MHAATQNTHHLQHGIDQNGFLRVLIPEKIGQCFGALRAEELTEDEAFREENWRDPAGEMARQDIRQERQGSQT